MTTRRGAAKGTGRGYRNLRGFPKDPFVHSQSAKGRKQPQLISPIYNQVRHKFSAADMALIKKWNMKAPNKKGMVLAGHESYTPDLKDFQKDWQHNFKEGYAHSYFIEPIREKSVNKFHIIYYKKDSPYSFYWKRGNENIYKNSSDHTAQEFLKEFRKQRIEPIEPYPVSSVERNMFLSHLEEAMDIAKPKDRAKLKAKATKMLALTPYTNWSGD